MNIVITGGSKGLGKAIAEKFGEDKQGHGIFLCARNEETLKAFAMDLQARFPRTNVQHFAADLSVQEEVTAFAEWIKQQEVTVDILVNNAGQFIPGSVHNEPEGVLEQLMAANLFSAYDLTRALLPAMMEARRGHIFNMCSIASLQAYANGGAYSISKFALAGFSQNLREEMKPYNIKVTTVYPGAAYTDSWAGSGVDPKRLMEAGDIASMIYTAAFLSPQACVEEIILRPQLGDL
ncbi:SDR family NAD(P)-dependent oxidoreductase [Filimonas effusa]|uniref:SDR family oxidoreductase n=1 Tax=Filimonas effusa TaxID=2508721 RepID=A0A4Q1CZB4_9BACT|nr:SDR family oxidoreductase [Filimonas effusa]RXK80740.1 SDR family oxidoreductase [Filimonas effusa]